MLGLNCTLSLGLGLKEGKLVNGKNPRTSSLMSMNLGQLANQFSSIISTKSNPNHNIPKAALKSLGTI